MQTFLDYIDEAPRQRQDLTAVSQFVAQQLYASIRSIHSSADIDEKIADLSTMVSLTAENGGAKVLHGSGGIMLLRAA